MVSDANAHYSQAVIVRLESEDAAFAEDVISVDRLRRGSDHPRNPQSCFTYGSRCEYYAVCWEGADLASDDFRDRERE